MPYYLFKIHIPLSPFLSIQYLTLTKRGKWDYLLLQLNLLFFYFFFFGQLAWHGQSISICSLFQEDIINYYSGKLNEIKHGREVPFQILLKFPHVSRTDMLYWTSFRAVPWFTAFLIQTKSTLNHQYRQCQSECRTYRYFKDLKIRDLSLCSGKSPLEIYLSV